MKIWDVTIGDCGGFIEAPEELKEFINDIESVYKKHGLSIEASHGGLSVRRYSEVDVSYLREAVKNY